VKTSKSSLALIKIILIGVTMLMLAIACNLPATTVGEQQTLVPNDDFEFLPRPPQGPYADFPFLPVLREPGEMPPAPTPDPERTLPAVRLEPTSHIVKAGETLRIIAENYAISLDAVIAANSDIADPNIISVGQQINIPPPQPGTPAPDFKLIPDSELVNGPYNAKIDLAAYIKSKGGYLESYGEEVDGEWMSGTEIIEMVASNYSVNPRLLLALLEYHSGWLTQPEGSIRNPEYPMGNTESWRVGLFYQAAWAANALNRGYYAWRVNGLGQYITTDGILIPASPRINAGTAGLHYMFALILPEAKWRQAVSADGFIKTYEKLYGYPFDWAVEPLIPPGLNQPALQLPFEPGVRWIFSGGAHGGWDGGSAWSALDFAPPKDQLGCIQNDEWVTAVAAGIVVRSQDGIVILDLDMDGHAETGWSIFYLHLETRDRVQLGTHVQAGDRIGHASCEGGVSTGTHVHIARRYNGEWIAINDQVENAIPFVMDGWAAVDTGELYNGYLTNGNRTIEPCQCKNEENKIERP
jgi:murein DD-endopeptidase MepM/ murein hydrolase activator NlpD